MLSRGRYVRENCTMEKEKTTCALIYDFDGTLAMGNCAEHGLMESLKINKDYFWAEVKERAKKDDGDEILAYLGLLSEKAKTSDELSENNLKKHGKKIPLFSGVETWFERIDKFGEELDLQIDHYIISSGLDAMIRGTSIAKKFKVIYACKYHYSENEGTAIWPAQAINYTTKTQFLFRINKGVLYSWDNKGINTYVEPDKRPMPFSQMIYFGDGDTDIPSMQLVRNRGGYSIAVFDEKKWPELAMKQKMAKLISEERATYFLPAIYDEYSILDVTVKSLLELMHRKKT